MQEVLSHRSSLTENLLNIARGNSSPQGSVLTHVSFREYILVLTVLFIFSCISFQLTQLLISIFHFLCFLLSVFSFSEFPDMVDGLAAWLIDRLIHPRELSSADNEDLLNCDRSLL